MLRLFFALQPTAEQNAALTGQAEPLIAGLQAQPVPAENLHVTLCFLGAVPEENLAPLKELASGIRNPAVALCFDSLEHWPKPRIVCACAPDDTAASPARMLAQQLQSVTSRAGFSADIKPFRGHITLARKVSAKNALRLEWPCVLAPPLHLHCDRFTLMQSRPGESGSVYSVVESWPLDMQ